MTWLLHQPTCSLTKAEQEWFQWAESGAKDALDDENWLADNEDALTVAGQLADMRYRLEEQAPDMMEHLAVAEARAGRRVLNSLLKKLEAHGYWNLHSHSTTQEENQK